MNKLFFILFIVLLCFASSFGQSVQREAILDISNIDQCETPILKGCELEEEPGHCSHTKMIELILSQIKYPAIAKENGQHGSIVIGWKINREGAIIAPKTYAHFEQGSEKVAKRVFQSEAFQAMSYQAISCLSEGAYAEVRIPVSFFFEQDRPLSLLNADQIICERAAPYASQEIRLKRLKKYFSASKPINQMWWYTHGFANFIDFNVELYREGKKVLELKNLVSFNNQKMEKLLSKISKKDTLIFKIKEEKAGTIRVVEKELGIK